MYRTLLNFPSCGHSRTCAPLTASLLIAAEAPQPLVCAIRAWSRPAGRQASRTPPKRASTMYRLDTVKRHWFCRVVQRRRWLAGDASTAQEAADNGALRRRAAQGRAA